MGAARVIINGRFLQQRVTGVQRFAHEMLFALDELMDADDARPPCEVLVVAPRGARPVALRRIPVRHVGPLSGHAWEQCTLPAVAGSSPIVSFGPTGPVAKRNQVVTIHDAAVWAVPESYGMAFRTWYRLLVPVLVRRARSLVTVSQFSKQELLRRLGVQDERVAVSGEGWQHMARLAADRTILDKHGLKPNSYFLAVSSLAPHKNLGVIARALSLLRDESNIRLVLAGEVDERLFAGVDLPDSSAIRRLGYVTDAELRALYETAAAFVFPSFYEGYGLPPLEAMAVDCPVIASNAGAIAEVCGDAPLYFDPQDATALAELMRRVTTNPGEREQMVRRGRNTLRRHSWQNAALTYLAIIRELARAGGHPDTCPQLRVPGQSTGIRGV